MMYMLQERELINLCSFYLLGTILSTFKSIIITKHRSLELVILVAVEYAFGCCRVLYAAL